MAHVRIEHFGLEWRVYLEERLVRTFDILGHALDFAALLETSPRQRSAAS